MWTRRTTKSDKLETERYTNTQTCIEGKDGYFNEPKAAMAV